MSDKLRAEGVQTDFIRLELKIALSTSVALTKQHA